MMDNVLSGKDDLIGLSGNNFSGRSAALHDTVRRVREFRGNSPRDQRVQSVYLGIDTHNFLSGLLPTVRGELDLHGVASSPHRDAAKELLSIIDSEALALQNPLTLSGGEQVVLALSTAVLSAERLLAIDCSLEQLSPASREKALAAFRRRDLHGLKILVADNRLREFAKCCLLIDAADFSPFATGQAGTTLSLTHSVSSNDAKALGLDNISFAYPGREVVFKSLNFQFEPGSVYFLTGENGVGKSTLAKLLCGLLIPGKGRLTIGTGKKWRPDKQPGDVVAYHFQNPDLQLFATRVADQLGHGAEEVIDAFGLAPFLQDHPQDLPFVLRKRLGLATAFARRRPWLILDEPILGQDDPYAESLARILESACRRGAGVIVITHSHSFMRLITPRRIVRIGRLGLEENVISDSRPEGR